MQRNHNSGRRDLRELRDKVREYALFICEFMGVLTAVAFEVLVHVSAISFAYGVVVQHWRIGA